MNARTMSSCAAELYSIKLAAGHVFDKDEVPDFNRIHRLEIRDAANHHKFHTPEEQAEYAKDRKAYHKKYELGAPGNSAYALDAHPGKKAADELEHQTHRAYLEKHNPAKLKELDDRHAFHTSPAMLESRSKIRQEQAARVAKARAADEHTSKLRAKFDADMKAIHEADNTAKHHAKMDREFADKNEATFWKEMRDEPDTKTQSHSAPVDKHSPEDRAKIKAFEDRRAAEHARDNTPAALAAQEKDFKGYVEKTKQHRLNADGTPWKEPTSAPAAGHTTLKADQQAVKAVGKAAPVAEHATQRAASSAAHVPSTPRPSAGGGWKRPVAIGATAVAASLGLAHAIKKHRERKAEKAVAQQPA